MGPLRDREFWVVEVTGWQRGALVTAPRLLMAPGDRLVSPEAQGLPCCSPAPAEQFPALSFAKKSQVSLPLRLRT